MHEKLVLTSRILPQKKPCQITPIDFLDLDERGIHTAGKIKAQFPSRTCTYFLDVYIHYNMS